MHTAKSPSAFNSKGVPVLSQALTLIFSDRSTCSKKPGTERHPSSLVCIPPRTSIVGLIKTSGSLCSADTSMTIIRLWTFTCVAARPLPGAAYIVSNRSSTKLETEVVTRSTFLATVLRRESGYSRIVSKDIKSNSFLLSSLRLSSHALSMMLF